MREARDLDDLLARPELVEKYYSALKAYYGETKFPRASFDAIVRQLKETKEKVPGFKERIWETTDLGASFALPAGSKTLGRTIDVTKWNEHLDAWKKSLAEEAGVARVSRRPEEMRERAAATLREVQARVDQFEREKLPAIAGSHPKMLARNEFYASLRQDRAIHFAVSYILLDRLKSEGVDDLLRSGDADLVLETMRNFHERPQEMFGNGERLPPITMTLLKARLPDRKELMAKTEIFPVEMRTTNRGKQVPVGSGSAVTYRVVPVPRRIHGIWKGIPLGECVGGNGNSLDSLTPERWATIALAGSQLMHVERVHPADSGIAPDYAGFVHLVPVHAPNGDLVGSMEIGAPALRRKAVLEGVEGKRITTLFDEWLGEALKHKPAAWKGFAMAESNAMANAGVLPTIRRSAAYTFGAPIGHGDNFTHPDPMAAELAKVYPNQGYLAGLYGGRMITEVTVKKAGEVTLLSERLPDSHFDDAGAAEKIFAGADVSAKRRLLNAMAARRVWTTSPVVERAVVDLFLGEDTNLRERALAVLQAVRPATEAVNVRLAEILDHERVYPPQIAELIVANRPESPAVARVLATKLAARSLAITAAVEALVSLAPRDEQTSLAIWKHIEWAYPTPELRRLRALVLPESPAVAKVLTAAVNATRPSPLAATILLQNGLGDEKAIATLEGQLLGSVENRFRTEGDTDLRRDYIRALARAPLRERAIDIIAKSAKRERGHLEQIALLQAIAAQGAQNDPRVADFLLTTLDLGVEVRAAALSTLRAVRPTDPRFFALVDGWAAAERSDRWYADAALVLAKNWGYDSPKVRARAQKCKLSAM